MTDIAEKTDEKSFSTSSTSKRHASNHFLTKTQENTSKKSYAARVEGAFVHIVSILGLRKFKKTYKESLMAYAFNIFGIVAGTAVAFQLRLFTLAPWAIAVYPAMVSARGVIGGLLSGRVSTALHLGTIRPSFFNNTKSFYSLLKSIVVLTLETSVLMSVVAVLFGSFLWGATLSDFVDILVVILSTMTMALIIITPLTVNVSIVSFKRGLDPDIVLYPIESTVSDLFITIGYFLVLNLFFSYASTGRYALGLMGLALLLVALYILLRNFREKEFVETVKESVLTMVFVAFIVNVTGSALGRIGDVVGSRREVYTAYPALIDTIGDVGAVVGSTATTKLALGTLKSSCSAIKSHKDEIFGAWVASITMFIIYSVLSLVIQGLFSFSNFVSFTALLLTANVMAASSIIIISFAVALVTLRRGLDPDNFVIPIESSLADGITTVSLLVALSLVG